MGRICHVKASLLRTVCSHIISLLKEMKTSPLSMGQKSKNVEHLSLFIEKGILKKQTLNVSELWNPFLEQKDRHELGTCSVV